MHEETFEDYNRELEGMRDRKRARMSASKLMGQRQANDSRKARMDDFAKHAMEALIASGKYASTDRWDVAKAAKAFADAMIVTLEEGK